MQTSQNGWILTGGNYYYIENGDMVNSKVCKIQNAWYAFDWYGKCMRMASIQFGM